MAETKTELQEEWMLNCTFTFDQYTSPVMLYAHYAFTLEHINYILILMANALPAQHWADWN